MNVNINKILVILILTIILTSALYSKEIVITVPEQYNTSELPLPPFPKEFVNKLDEEVYESDILSKQSVRWLKQRKISYKYYIDIYQSDLSNKMYLGHTVMLSTDFDDFIGYYKPELYNNNFLLGSYIEYDTDQSIFDFGAEYKEYRLPVNLELSGEKEDEIVFFNIDYTDYFSKVRLETFYQKNFYGTFLFRDDRFIRPLVTAGYYDDSDYYTALALGYNFNRADVRLGPVVVNDNIYGYCDIDFNYNHIIINADTIVERDKIEYLLESGYKKNSYLKLGGGLTVVDETDRDFNPFISLKENLILGEREYRFYEDEVSIVFKVLRNSMLTQFSVSIVELNNLVFTVENGIYNRYNVKSSLEYDNSNDEITGRLEFEYKVGKK